MLVSLKCSQNLKWSNLTLELLPAGDLCCSAQGSILVTWGKQPYTDEKMSFFEADIHKYIRNITYLQPIVHIILIAVQYILDICFSLDDKTMVESLRKLLKRTKSVENRAGKKPFNLKHHEWRTGAEWEFLKMVLSGKVLCILNPFHISRISTDKEVMYSSDIEFYFKMGWIYFRWCMYVCVCVCVSVWLPNLG